MKQNALEGLRVLDFTQIWSGPYCTMLMALYGAEVIKIESEKRPDRTRLFSVMLARYYEGRDTSPLYNTLNLNKLGITLNLTQRRGVDLVRELVKVSDVVVENFRPGVMAKLGIDYESLREINPKLIYLSSSSRGGTGPEWDYAGLAFMFSALGGLSYITGYADGLPSKTSGRTDLIVGMTALFAILSALIHRTETGRGQYIDLSSSEAITALMGDVFMEYAMNGRNQTRQGNRDAAMAPHNCYRCAGEDQWISIACASDGEWRALCEAMNRPDLAADERFSGVYARKENEVELDRLIGEWTATFTPTQAVEMLRKAGVAAAPSRSSRDLLADDHLRQRGAFLEIDHPDMGRQTLVGAPWKLTDDQNGLIRHAPLFGQHNDYVFEQLLGLSPKQVEELRREEVIY
ncbi:MAG: CoA transferase [Deltaproteobacteria bacterium]|nr:CoA transferase [Deltaproteobacteria bacterium]